MDVDECVQCKQQRTLIRTDKPGKEPKILNPCAYTHTHVVSIQLSVLYLSLGFPTNVRHYFALISIAGY